MDKKHFIKKLSEILGELDFTEGIEDGILVYISDNYSLISDLADKACKKDWDYYLIKKENSHIAFMVLVYKIVDLEMTYKSKKLPRDVLIDTLSDLTLRQKIYYQEHKKLGLAEEDIAWLKHIYYLDIFKLGSLQYEVAKMDYSDCPKDKSLEGISKGLPAGSNILKVHIRRGVDLSKKEVDKSFKLSKEFFKIYYPYDYIAYTCFSWMLYSKNNLMLSSESRILKFAKRFELFCEIKRRDMAIKYIFGREYEDIKDYSTDTSLQRNAIKNFDNLGVGYGVIYRDEI